MDSLSGKVALITGGASGIGEATVRLFAAEGARVVIADIQDTRGERLAAELGEQACYIHLDVTQESQIKAALDRTLEWFGRLDCLFNNAGAPGQGGPLQDLSVESWDKIQNILLRGPFLGMKYATPIMKRQGTGSIISTASIAGLEAGRGDYAYSVAKAGLIHLTRLAAKELGESGIRVNCICPGAIATPIFGRALGLDTAQSDQTAEVMKYALADAQPIRRAGLPADVAQVALWLASEASGFVNGHALVVDGGLTGGISWAQSQMTGELLTQALAGTL
jgi:NAD(P)-dependent dehydrogenase (short-subunit alcohol dehydrogenase family)